jgi:hemerythrin-like domain-containing protein
MRRDELYSQHIATLVREHRELATLLQSVDLSDADDQNCLRRAVDDLHEHIAKEEDGLFPASLTALGGEDWDAAMAAWHRAHPDQHLIADAHRRDHVAGRNPDTRLRPSGAP